MIPEVLEGRYFMWADEKFSDEAAAVVTGCRELGWFAIRGWSLWLAPCPACGNNPLQGRGWSCHNTGPPPRYCDGACRVAAFRKRKRLAELDPTRWTQTELVTGSGHE